MFFSTLILNIKVTYKNKNMIKIDFFFIFQSIAMIESNLLPITKQGNKEFDNITLFYTEKARELAYRQIPNAKFRYDLGCASVLFSLVILTQFIVLKRYYYEIITLYYKCLNILFAVK